MQDKANPAQHVVEENVPAFVSPRRGELRGPAGTDLVRQEELGCIWNGAALGICVRFCSRGARDAEGARDPAPWDQLYNEPIPSIPTQPLI